MEKRITKLSLLRLSLSGDFPVILRGDTENLSEEEQKNLEELKKSLEDRKIPYVIDINSFYVGNV